METSPNISKQLEAELLGVLAELGELLPGLKIELSQLQDVLSRHAELVSTWGARQAGKPDAFGRVRNSFLDLTLWNFLKDSNDSDERREILGALWKQSEVTIRYKAYAFVKNVGSWSRKEDKLEEMMQEGFLKFESKIEAYDPSDKKKGTIRTFLASCYRNQFDNMCQSKVMVGLKEDSLPESVDSTDEDAETPQKIYEDREVVDLALMQIAGASQRDAEKVEAFKKVMDYGMTNKEVAEQMGRSESWASKSHNRILQLLQDEIKQ